LQLRFKKIVLFLALALCFAPAVARKTEAGTLETIQGKIAQALRRPGIRSTHWGIEIADANKQVLVAVNEDHQFLPASVLKVLTTATALNKLGPDFRFRTTVYTNGEVHPDGNLLGDLFLVGRGDPNLIDPSGEILERSALAELAEKLQALGIQRITGNIIGDDSYFTSNSHGIGWTAEDLRSTYGAPISALSINNNIYWVHATPAKSKQLVSIWVDPPSTYFRVRNLAVTGAANAKRSIGARVIPGTRSLVVSGTLPLGQSFGRYLLLEKPAEAAAGQLRDELVRRGVHVGGTLGVLHYGEMSQELRHGWKPLAEHLSPPLVKAVEIINKKSQNLHAEMLLRTLGAEFRGIGTDEAGVEVLKEFIVSAGIDTRGLNLKDGCGLSRENLVTPHFQTSLLLALAGRPHFELFMNTLAVSGTDGTLKHRFAAEPVRGVIHAKTGSLNGVSALSGYMTTKSGKSLAFSIFANNAATSIKRIQKTIDEICALFVNLY
jgi:serine-type D-Ala-D-Ala carboxypeptidase/endopeptidase (penicillin-binding protein 4)